MDLFAEIADERRGMADLVAGLTEEQLATPSLCGAWDVRSVVAHLLMPLVTSTPKFAIAMLRAGGNFNKANIQLTASVAKRPTADLIAGLREHADSQFTPPGFGPEAPLTDVLVHGQDIRRPLGIERTFPPDRIRVELDFLLTPAATRGLVRKGILDGLELSATDLDWSAGSGEQVTGSAEAIMMSLTGRTVALADLGGPGADVLSARFESR
ncbi:MAG: maleylpyruvate isomerase family mycothiol-dependent enzyme [Actinomycetes bacterium]